ncbi:MAG: UDP-N-acetylmuramate dehydrogenase [Methylophagaceae bacterium]|jgi:UDP-N-acetylmuramate dehydrogenase
MTDFLNLHGELKINEPLAKHTSWRVGGPAHLFYKPTDKVDLGVFLSQLPVTEPILWLGLGSNLLVRDGGFPGAVISTAGILQNFTVNERSIEAEVGVYCSKLAKQAAKASLNGAAFFAGIPGTFGGALAMNAGAHGTETWTLVSQVTTVDRQGQFHQRTPDEFEISYRNVVSPNEEWFISGTVSLKQGDQAQETAEIKTLLKRRNETQPTNQPCAGSVFRNPGNDFAGRLIELSGLKGLSIGGAAISEKHANFIVNTGDATADDIESLILLIQQKIALEHGVELQAEVHIVGETR